MQALCICGIHLVDIIRVHRQNRRCHRHIGGATVPIGVEYARRCCAEVFRGRRLPREWSYGGWKQVVRVLKKGCAGGRKNLKIRIWALPSAVELINREIGTSAAIERSCKRHS